MQWLILAAIIIFLYLMFTKRGGPAAIFSMGKSQAREVTDESATFEDVGGVEEAKEELQEVVDFLRNPDRYSLLGARIPRGVLLVGPPGTGKTLLARAVSGEAGVPYYQLAGSDFNSMLVGVGVSRVRDMFKKARQNIPCIIFIDEVDAMGKARGGISSLANDDREQTLNQLLVELDGFDSAVGVILMAATNRPELLDPALLRAGRFDRHILVDRPDMPGRLEILKIHAKDITLDAAVDLKSVAGRTPGFAGADLANLVNEAALLAARRHKATVTSEEFHEAIERVMLGLEKKGRVVSAEERRRTAYHELGHAVVAEILPSTDPVQKVSIIPRGISMGLTSMSPQEDRFSMTTSQLKDRITMLLGGRAAELLFIGEADTGAQMDLAQASEMAGDMVRKYGMSSLGLRTFERPRTSMLAPDLPISSPRDHGEETAVAIDREVNSILEEGLQQATSVLKEQRVVVESLFERLMEHQQLEGKEVREALGLPPMEEQPEAEAKVEEPEVEEPATEEPTPE